jgi:hypothetical protein
LEYLNTNPSNVAQQIFDPLGPIYYGEVKPKQNQQLQVNTPDHSHDYKQLEIFSIFRDPAYLNKSQEVENPQKIPAETYSYPALMNSSRHPSGPASLLSPCKPRQYVDDQQTLNFI